MKYKIPIHRDSVFSFFQTAVLDSMFYSNYEVKDRYIYFETDSEKQLFEYKFNQLKKNAVLYFVEKGFNKNRFRLMYIVDDKSYDLFYTFSKGNELRYDDPCIDMILVEDLGYKSSDIRESMFYSSIFVYSNERLLEILNTLKESLYSIENDISIRRLSYNECLYDCFGRSRDRTEFYNVENFDIGFLCHPEELELERKELEELEEKFEQRHSGEFELEELEELDKIFEVGL